MDTKVKIGVVVTILLLLVWVLLPRFSPDDPAVSSTPIEQPPGEEPSLVLTEPETVETASPPAELMSEPIPTPEEESEPLQRGTIHPTGSFSGQVVMAHDGTPLMRAEVRIRTGAVLTDEQGRFEIADVKFGLYQFWLKHSDYGNVTSGEAYRVDNATPHHEVRILAYPLPDIEGRVTIDGKPAPGIRVHCRYPSANGWDKESTTDENGMFIIENVRVYNAIVEATTDFAKLSKLISPEFQTSTTVNFDFRSSSGVIEGTVTLRGEPNAQIEFVKAVPADAERSEESYRSPPDEDGYYRIENLPTGTYSVYPIIGEPTYYQDVEQIVVNKCNRCHGSSDQGGTVPEYLEFKDFKTVRAWGVAMQEVLTLLNAGHEDLLSNGYISEAELDVLLAWAKTKFRRGEETDESREPISNQSKTAIVEGISPTRVDFDLQ
jgi:hypothetical protein